MLWTRWPATAAFLLESEPAKFLRLLKRLRGGDEQGHVHSVQEGRIGETLDERGNLALAPVGMGGMPAATAVLPNSLSFLFKAAGKSEWSSWDGATPIAAWLRHSRS